MKKAFLVLVVLITFVSCDATSEDNGTQYFIAPVENATMPSTFKVDSTSQIMIAYKRPSQCHIFNGFYYDVDQTTRTVAVQFAKLQQSECMEDETVYNIPLLFKPTSPGTYLFRFWNGTNAEGQDTYIEAEALVGQ